MASTLITEPDQATAAAAKQEHHHHTVASRRNWLGGALGWIWVAIVMLPIYWIVITSFKTTSDYYDTNPLVPTGRPTLNNYRLVIETGFVRYFVNSLIVTVGAVVPAVAISFMAAYRIVRGSNTNRYLRGTNGLFLMGLAIPLQATIIPVYLIIIRMSLYDSLVRASSCRRSRSRSRWPCWCCPTSSATCPGNSSSRCGWTARPNGGTLWRLAFPLTRPAVVTVSIYTGLQVWNGFLLPLVLTQSPDAADAAARPVDLPGRVRRERPGGARLGRRSPPCRS